MLKLHPRRKHFSSCKAQTDPWLESFGLLIEKNYNSQDYWTARKEFWLQQRYWFERSNSISSDDENTNVYKASSLNELSEKDSASKQSESLDFNNRPIYIPNDDFRGNEFEIEEASNFRNDSTNTAFLGNFLKLIT